jgi:O-antigen/teichoic acid export membrane protein
MDPSDARGSDAWTTARQQAVMTSVAGPAGVPTAAPRPPLAHTSLARLFAEGAGVFFGAITGIITARWLEPEGKGTLSTLLFVVNVLFFYACSLGLSDAATILKARRRLSLLELFRANSLPALASSVAGIVLSFAFAGFLFRGDHPAALDAALVASLTLPVWVFYELFAGLLNSDEGFVFTSVVAVGAAVLTAVATWALVVVMDGGLVGAVAGSIGGPLVGLVVLTLALARRGALRLPRWDPSYTRAALRLGVPLQASYLLIAMSQRFDQLMVYGIAGRASAGHYSIALTLGLLVTHAPSALSMASFPRVAHLEAAHARRMTERLSRVGLAGAAMIGGAVAVAAPWLIPLAFGEEYRPAIAPTLILIVGGLFWGEQWILARALAARGETVPMIRCYAANVLVMVMLDLVLIPPLGVVGAALASAGGSMAGLALCLGSYRKRDPELQLGALLPSVQDLRDLLGDVRTLVRRTR